MSEKIGPFEVIGSIGKGGMGEVLLVRDKECERVVALKRIRTDLKDRGNFKARFLREAKITASLTHPGIIAIYSIFEEAGEIYYTMPYVEGKTFRQILKKEGGVPIASLLPIFKSICQTVAYAHSKGIIHRDLKPENILVGNFGEVILLDWGLAQLNEENDEGIDEIEEATSDLTSPGKIVGTLAYMAPERALGSPATVQSDLYALGVILYQILTWHLPFERKTIKEFRKNYSHEKLVDPEEIAPYRDVPPNLSRMVKKALAPDRVDRYQHMEEFLHDLAAYMEGRSEWYETVFLDVKKKSDWEFQENVLLAKHVAVTPAAEAAEWVSLMVSKASFAENIHLELQLHITKESGGIGILLSVPESAERENPLTGYCLWLGSEKERGSFLYRNTVEVMKFNDFYLKPDTTYTLIIEKIDNKILFTFNEKKFKYVSYLPLVGTHVGIMARDDAFHIEKFSVSLGLQNLKVSCLSIPDAFLSNKEFKRALAEYRRLSLLFPGHAEGREAKFRAGITLVEQAKNERNEKKKEKAFTAALEEFSKLHTTASAPLEYLGKALVYEALGDHSEEIKCYELALRRYHDHPLLRPIVEQIIYRMHASASRDRKSAYGLILIVLRQLPKIASREDSKPLFRGLLAHAEPLPFVENPLDPSHFGREENEREQKLALLHFAALLAFWIANPFLLEEIFDDVLEIEPLDPPLIGNIIYFLFEMGAKHMGEKLIEKVRAIENEELKEITSLLEPLSAEMWMEKLSKKKDIGLREWRSWSYLIQECLKNRKEQEVEKIAKILEPLNLSLEDRIELDSYRIWAFLAKDQIEKAGAIFDKYQPELLNQETTLLHPLYGCYLYATEGEEIALIHFSGVIDTPFPRSWALLGHEIAGKISENPDWIKTSFPWERKKLYRQMALWFHITNDLEKETKYRQLEILEDS